MKQRKYLAPILGTLCMFVLAGPVFAGHMMHQREMMHQRQIMHQRQQMGMSQHSTDSTANRWGAGVQSQVEQGSLMNQHGDGGWQTPSPAYSQDLGNHPSGGMPSPTQEIHTETTGGTTTPAGGE